MMFPDLSVNHHELFKLPNLKGLPMSMLPARVACFRGNLFYHAEKSFLFSNVLNFKAFITNIIEPILEKFVLRPKKKIGLIGVT